MAEENHVSTYHPTCMESVNRLSKLPVVESTIQTATSLYEKVKEYNSVTNWTLSTAEITAKKAVEVGKPIVTPVIQKLEEPIKKVDNVLCSGLDYVEAKVPAVKLPPGELLLQMYNTTKEYLTPAVETAKSYAEPAYKTAKDIVEPAVEKTMNLVEPYVQPAMEKAHQIKENVMHKVDEYLHRGHECPEGNPEVCDECKRVRERVEQMQQEQQQQQDPQEHHQDHQEHYQHHQEERHQY